jgi:hypothetical protein
MNKAFLREPDQSDSRCPACLAIGQSVGAPTLAAQLPGELRRRFADSAWFCRTETCPVVYFDDFGARVERAELPRAVPIKDADAPLCGCFGLTREDIETDVAEGVVTRTKAVVLKAQSPDARCETQSPSGQPCVAEVQSYYVRCKERSK